MEKHLSDCAIHNEPAMPNSECDCLEDRYTDLGDRHLSLAIKYAELADKYADLKKTLWGDR